MNRGAEGSSGRGRAIEVLRWIGVLPAAALGGFAAKILFGLVGRLAVPGWGAPPESWSFAALRLLVFYVPTGAAFVIAGAMLAPRGRRATAIVLAAFKIVMSLVVHILGQRNPGVVNSTHFAAETAGAALGVACIVFLEFRSRRGPRPGPGQEP